MQIVRNSQKKLQSVWPDPSNQVLAEQAQSKDILCKSCETFRNKCNLCGQIQAGFQQSKHRARTYCANRARHSENGNLCVARSKQPGLSRAEQVIHHDNSKNHGFSTFGVIFAANQEDGGPESYGFRRSCL